MSNTDEYVQWYKIGIASSVTIDTIVGNSI